MKDFPTITYETIVTLRTKQDEELKKEKKPTISVQITRKLNISESRILESK